MSLKEIKDVSYFKLNNEINRPVDGQIPLNKDKEALAAFFKENVEPNTLTFATAMDKINYLIENGANSGFWDIQNRLVGNHQRNHGSFKRSWHSHGS